MRKSNTAQAVEPASDLRQRAARARDAAGRFIRHQDPPPEADEADAELMHLGAQLDDAITRAGALSNEWMRVVDAASAALPPRPACLFFQASDQTLYLRTHLLRPAELDGMEVTADDVSWLRRKPYAREVRRPVRPEDGLPADAHTVVELHPWPEAQARADEIITAWDAWKAECAQVRASIEDEEADAEERAEAVEVEIFALVDRIAAMPAATAEGLRIKLRASAHYVEEHDADYPAGRLLNSLLRDAQVRMAAPVSAPHPDAALLALGGEFVAAWVAEEETADGARYWACNRLAQQIVQTPAVTVAGLGIKALLLARLDEDDSSPRKPAKAQGPIASHWNVLRQVQEGAARIAAGPETGISARDGRSAGPSLVALLDLASATMDELRTIRELSDHVGTAAYAHSWRGCCHRRDNPVCASDYNDAGKLMHWLGDALTDVETAVDKEVARRIPESRSDREARLSVRAVPIIDDGDPEAIRAFALELLDHAAAESRGH